MTFNCTLFSPVLEALTSIDLIITTWTPIQTINIARRVTTIDTFAAIMCVEIDMDHNPRRETSRRN